MANLRSGIISLSLIWERPRRSGSEKETLLTNLFSSTTKMRGASANASAAVIYFQLIKTDS